MYRGGGNALIINVLQIGKCEIFYLELIFRSEYICRTNQLISQKMKQSIIYVFTILSSLAFFVNAYGEEPEYAPKHVIMTERGTLIEDRDTHFNVQVYLYGDSLSIEANSIGLAEVFIVDAWSKVVGYDIYNSETGFLSINTPYLAGIYTIVICSDIYYGEGTFTIE